MHLKEWIKTYVVIESQHARVGKDTGGYQVQSLSTVKLLQQPFQVGIQPLLRNSQ